MSIDKDLYKLQSTPNVAAGWDEQTMDFVLNLEVLNYCAHNCPGCFVRRKNSMLDVSMPTAVRLAQDMAEKGLRFREIVLSPTDIFSAKNSLEVLDDPYLHDLLRINPKTRITTTAMFQDMDWDNFLAVFGLLDDPKKFRENMILEFLVPMDVEKVLARDSEYFAQFDRAIGFLENETPKEVDWSFVVNVHYDPELFRHYDVLTEIAREEFNTVIEFLPSFFRTGSDRFVTHHLQIWRDFLREVVNEGNYRDIMLTIADLNHNALNTVVVNYRRGELFISPFIYEQILFEYPELMVDNFEADKVLEKVQELTLRQYQYAPKTTECSSCAYLQTCIGRNVLSFMEIKGLKDCIYPKEILDLYHQNGVDPRSPRVKRCADNIE